MEQEPRTFSVIGAAQTLGISRASVYRLIQRGELPAVRLGWRLVIPREAIDELLRQANPMKPARALPDADNTR